MSRQAQGLIAINIAAIIFGTAALYGKLNVSPFWIVGMRALFAAAALLVIALWRKQLTRIGKTSCALLFTGIMLSLHWLTFFISVQWSGIAVATLTFAAFPFFTLIIDALKNRRRLHWIEMAASATIIFAVSLLVKVETTSTHVIYGAIAGVFSALLFAVFGIMSKSLTASLPTLTVSFYQNLVVCVSMLPFLPFTVAPSSNVDWTFLVMLGIVTTALMHQLYFYALQRLSAGTCSGFVALEPVYAILFSALLFNEPLTMAVIVSGVLIVAASFLILKS